MSTGPSRVFAAANPELSHRNYVTRSSVSGFESLVNALEHSINSDIPSPPLKLRPDSSLALGLFLSDKVQNHRENSVRRNLRIGRAGRDRKENQRGRPDCTNSGARCPMFVILASEISAVIRNYCPLPVAASTRAAVCKWENSFLTRGPNLDAVCFTRYSSTAHTGLGWARGTGFSYHPGTRRFRP